MTIFMDEQEQVEQALGPGIFSKVMDVVQSPIFPIILRGYGKGLGVSLILSVAIYTIKFVQGGGLDIDPNVN